MSKLRWPLDRDKPFRPVFQRYNVKNFGVNSSSTFLERQRRNFKSMTYLCSPNFEL